MDDLTTLANRPGRGSRIFRGLIAEDAETVNDELKARLPAYDPSRQFGPFHFHPRPRADGVGVLLPSRNDPCLVALDENDQADLLSWWVEDPTEETHAGPYVNAGVFMSVAAAAASIPATGGALFVPRGLYNESITITGIEHLKILGEGSSSVIHNDTPGADAIRLIGCPDVVVEGIRVQGEVGTQDGLSLWDCPRSTVRDLYCGGTGRYGVYAETCIAISVNAYCGPDTPGPYPTGVEPMISGLVLTWDGVTADSGCNGALIDGGSYVVGQFQSQWAVRIDHAENVLVNGPVAELSGGGIYANACEQLVVNGYYGEANPSDIEYSTGTVAVTSGSTVVTGTGTAFSTLDGQGHPNAWKNKYLFVGSKWARILTAASGTSLTLAENWPGSTASGQAYTISSIDLLMEACKNCNILMGRGGGTLALKGSSNNRIRAVTERIVIDSTSADNDIDVTTNRASSSASRVVNSGSRNRVRQRNWQDGSEVQSGSLYAGDRRPAWFVDAAVSAAHTSGLAFVTGQALVNWPMLMIETGGKHSWGSGNASAADTHLERTGNGFLTITSGFTFPAIAAGSVPNNSLFRDSADNKLKFKDNAGTVNALY